jgi:hypothetical protein
MNLASISRESHALAIQVGAPTPITLQWIEWPDGKPDVDPTTGASPSTDDSEPVQKSCSVKALFHSAQPTRTEARMYAEIQVGDAILDFLSGLVRVRAVGDTDLEVGDVLGQFEFNEVNRELEDGDTAATASAVELEDLEQLAFVIDGRKWVQAKIGEQLARAWDSIFGQTKFARSILIRRFPGLPSP